MLRKDKQQNDLDGVFPLCGIALWGGEGGKGDVLLITNSSSGEYNK